MSEHELLLRHAETWASAKNRTLDHDLLAATLRVWIEHEGHSAMEWPSGSARCLLRHWSHAGPTGDSDVGTLVASLETFWRFLRSTGRMRSGSAEPKTLVKEARRAVRQLPETSRGANAGPDVEAAVGFGDGARHGVSMSVEETLTEHSAGLGPDLLGEDDEDYFDDDYEDDLDEDYTHEATWALLPGAIHEWAKDPTLQASAHEARQSPFVRECLRFARWIGDGQRITNGALRPAQVLDAEVEFGLKSWEREFLSRSPLKGPGTLDAQALPGHRPAGILGGLDHLVTTRALQSLWHACMSAGLIETGSTTVRATHTAHPQHERSDDDWALLGQRALTSAVVTRHFLEPMDPVLRVLFPFLRTGVDKVEERDVQAWWWEHEANPWGRLGLRLTEAHRSSDRQVRRLLWAMGDTGVWRRDGQALHRTALGMDVAIQLMDDLHELLHAG